MSQHVSEAKVARLVNVYKPQTYNHKATCATIQEPSGTWAKGYLQNKQWDKGWESTLLNCEELKTHIAVF